MTEIDDEEIDIIFKMFDNYFCVCMASTHQNKDTVKQLTENLHNTFQNMKCLTKIADKFPAFLDQSLSKYEIDLLIMSLMHLFNYTFCVNHINLHFEHEENKLSLTFMLINITTLIEKYIEDNKENLSDDDIQSMNIIFLKPIEIIFKKMIDILHNKKCDLRYMFEMLCRSDLEYIYIDLDAYKCINEKQNTANEISDKLITFKVIRS